MVRIDPRAGKPTNAHRRSVIAAVFAGAICPAASQTRAGRKYRVGLLPTITPAALITTDPAWEPIVEGLRELGWVDGKNIELIWRSAEGDYDRRGGIIDEFIGLRVDVIVVFSPPAARIALQKTRTIPVVHAGASRLTDDKLIESLARPGGNLTGVTEGPNLNPKRLALLKAVAPATTHVGLLNQIPASQAALAITEETRAAANSLGLGLMSLRFWTIDELDVAVADARYRGANAMMVMQSPRLAVDRNFQHSVHEVLARHRLPAIYALTSSAESGGLMAYAANLQSFYRAASRHIDAILRGARPADIPIEQPSRYELTVNLNTARKLGLTIPAAVRAEAHRLVE